MLSKFKLMTGQLLNSQKARAFFILTMLVTAVLIGGAPSDMG